MQLTRLLPWLVVLLLPLGAHAQQRIDPVGPGRVEALLAPVATAGPMFAHPELSAGGVLGLGVYWPSAVLRFEVDYTRGNAAGLRTFRLGTNAMLEWRHHRWRLGGGLGLGHRGFSRADRDLPAFQNVGVALVGASVDLAESRHVALTLGLRARLDLGPTTGGAIATPAAVLLFGVRFY